MPQKASIEGPGGRHARHCDGMAAPNNAAAGGTARSKSLAARFAEAEAAAAMEGDIADVLSIYGDARRIFEDLQAARAQLQRAHLPDGPLIDSLITHLASADLSLCASGAQLRA